MDDFEQAFPEVLTELHRHEFDYDDGNGIDFEPYEEFQSASENADWIKAWTGNQDLDGAEYRIFGQDGTGGLAAFWLIRDGADILEQPVVFFGSEGQLGVIAYDFADYLWLLASGVGPMEAAEYGADENNASAVFKSFAEKHAANAKKTGAAVLERAREAFPSFAADIEALCR